MTVIPFQINSEEFSLFIALGDDSVSRIKQYDPAQVNMRKLPPQWRSLKLRDILVGYITKADRNHIGELQKNGHGDEVLKYLSRGFQFKPEAGDHDGPYLSAKSDGSKPT